MKTKDKKKIIRRAIERIQSGQFKFCCTSLGCESKRLSDEFSHLFSPSTNKQFWIFTTIGTPTKEQIAIRITALWFFYHMQ